MTHDGRYGAIAGKAVALEPSTGFSFDSPMVYEARAEGRIRLGPFRKPGPGSPSPGGPR